MNIFKRDKKYYYNKRIVLFNKSVSFRKTAVLAVIMGFGLYLIYTYLTLKDVPLELLLSNTELIFSHLTFILIFIIVILHIHDYRRFSIFLIIFLVFINLFEFIYFYSKWYKIYNSIISMWFLYVFARKERDIPKDNESHSAE